MALCPAKTQEFLNDRRGEKEKNTQHLFNCYLLADRLVLITVTAIDAKDATVNKTEKAPPPDSEQIHMQRILR